MELHATCRLKALCDHAFDAYAMGMKNNKDIIERILIMAGENNVRPDNLSDVRRFTSYLVDVVVNPFSYFLEPKPFRWSDVPAEQRAFMYGALFTGIGLIFGGPVALPVALVKMLAAGAGGYYGSLIQQLIEAILK